MIVLALKKLCSGCGKIIDMADGMCPDCKMKRERIQEERRGTATQRGYDSKWRKARKGYLREHPLCVECMKEGKYVPATVVDHIKPHKGDKKLFWDKNNWQPLCERHHGIKTAKEDGGFGNKGRGE